MTTQDIVDAPAAVTRGRLLINIAEGIETEDMPCPIAITFYEKDSPGWDRVDTLSISFADSRDLSIWIARLGWTVTIAPTPSHDGSRLIHSAHGDFHGWKVSANATDPVDHAEPSTEEPERTLTAIEDHAIREPWSDPNDEVTGADWPTTDAETVTADVDAKTAEAVQL